MSSSVFGQMPQQVGPFQPHLQVMLGCVVVMESQWVFGMELVWCLGAWVYVHVSGWGFC
jgi:hypothetical protein